MLEPGSLEDIQDSMDFSIGAYIEDLRSLAVADERLDQMEEEVTLRELGDKLSVEEDETPERPNAVLVAAISANSDKADEGLIAMMIAYSHEDPLRPLNKSICLITSLGLDID
jgi:capsular polysaccharide biosynthesis protein